jgi:hypothetical protein
MHRERTGNSGPQVLGVFAQHFQLIAAQSLTVDRPLWKIRAHRELHGSSRDLIDIKASIQHDGLELTPLRFGISELLKLCELDHRRRLASLTTLAGAVGTGLVIFARCCAHSSSASRFSSAY